MHRFLPIVMLAGMTMLGTFGQDAGPQNPYPPLQKFEDLKSMTTPAFTVADQWEVRWVAHRPIDVTVLAADNSVVAGANSFRGALYVPKGGSYHLQIDSPDLGGTPAPVSHPLSGLETTINNGFGNQTNAPPPPPAFQQQPWHVEVVQINSPASQNPGFMPNYTVPTGVSTASPVAVTTPAAPAPVAGATADGADMSTDQAKAVVLIKGDNAEGTGFMVKTPDGPVVITNIHVIANNPNLKVTTSTGALITVLSEKGASDRDLAMLSIKDFGFSFLQMAPDISTVVQPGDEVITPGNSQGGEVMLNTKGKVLGIGPVRIEIDNPIYHGNSGGPVFHTKSGKVLGVVTEATKVEMTNDLDKTSFASRNSAIAGNMRYFALRLDTVTEWIPIDSRRFQIETTFLDQFHEQSRRLDAYLNSDSQGRSGGQDVSNIYLSDEKIVKASTSYQERASGGDTAEHLEALRGLQFDLQAIVDINLDQIQDPNNFYSFDRGRAMDELEYRRALKAEVDSLGNDIERISHLPRTNN